MHREVARGFRTFLMRSAAGHVDDVQVLHGAYGARRLPEQELDLSGYRDSAPVRGGNAAATQVQLDGYGHILSAAYSWHDRHDPMDPDEWRLLAGVVDAAASAWREPDRGLWEIRGAPRHFVQSKVMLWVALDRGVRLAESGLDTEPDRVLHWREQRRQLADAIERRGVDPDRGWSATWTPARPGCVSVLALQGRVEEAQVLFERPTATGNDLGLFSEEYDPQAGELLGNFPQAFTHRGLLQAASQLAAARGG